MAFDNETIGHQGLAYLSMLLIVLQYEIICMAQVFKRKQVYSKEYMQKFDEIHEREVGGKAPAFGYPDTGNGRYSTDLSYPDWFSFNNFQRVQNNFLEQITPMLVWIFIGSFYQPLASAILGFVYFFGRIFFSIGYCKSPKHRIVGAIICDLGYIGSFILSIVTIGKWQQY
eukprot:403348298